MIWTHPERVKWLRSLKEGDYVQILMPLVPDFEEIQRKQYFLGKASTLYTKCLVLTVSKDKIIVDWNGAQHFSKQTGLRDDKYSAIFP